MNQSVLKRFVLLFFLCGALFLFGNNLFHLTDPDEVFYSLTTKEMIDHHEWLTPYIFNQPQFEKPILTYWFIKAAFTAFGQTPFAARFFPAIFASFGVLAIYSLGLLGFTNERKAFLSALILATSSLYLAMGKTVFTDMIFTVLILYSLLSFYFAYSYPLYKRAGLLAFYLFAALAVLAKGPLGFLIPQLVVVIFLIYRRELSFLKTPWLIVGVLLGLLVAGPWYWYEYARYGHNFIHEFFYNDHWRRLMEAEHRSNDRWYFYPLTMIMGIFPWSLFLLAAFGNLYKKLKYPVKPVEHFLLSWILVVFVIFQLAHSKLASYILPIFPALALLAANYLDEKIDEYPWIVKRLNYCLIGFLTLLAIGVVAAFKVYKSYIPTILPGYWLSAALISLGGISLTLLFKDKVYHATILLGFSMVPVFLAAFMITSFLEPHISMYDASCYIPSMTFEKTTILTTKPYARGVRFYTNQNVAILGIGEENYFSPHPIAILNTKEKVDSFLKSQKQTFAIIKKSGYEYLSKTFSGQFKISVLKISGRNYILKIAPLNAS
jgi:4-amino-4-deoxy-L-arabinose transferase-like glycosyltransferase